MSKLIIRVQQHTPIIHFQHEQMGATLRATEVKPKLDKWIKDLYNNNIPSEWKIKGTQALNYKLKIVPTGNYEPPQNTGKNTPMYFADMGNPENGKKLSFNRHPIQLDFLVPNPVLRNVIEEQIGSFFFHENFGTRQNKGYGSFFQVKDGKLVMPDGDFPCLQFELDSSINQAVFFRSIFLVIDYYYRRLKSGVDTDSSPSFLDIYYRKNIDVKSRMQIEKNWIKKMFLNVGQLDHEPPVRFIRALLGLTYFFKYPKINNQLTVQTRHHPSKNSQKIRRIKSPLTFVPCVTDNSVKVFVLINNNLQKAIKKHALNQDFLFIKKEKSDKESKNKGIWSKKSNAERLLSTPSDVIPLKDLLFEYHKHLGNSFTTFDSTGKYVTKVTIL